LNSSKEQIEKQIGDMIRLWVNQVSLTDDKWTALHLACKDSEDHRIFMYLFKELKANPTIRNIKGVSLMHMAATWDNTYLITYLRDKVGVSINEQDYKGNTPLFYSCSHGSEWAAFWLIAFGADVNAKNFKKDSPLHMILNNPEHIFSTKTVRELIFKGAEVNAKNQSDKRPIDYIDTLKDEHIKAEL
jgi:ankyrin repeat protein